MTDEDKTKARELLNELDNIKGPGQRLRNWKIKAQTFLVFAAIKKLKDKKSYEN